jgi:succinate dehydrogenase hydrophobic anchor subunit
LGRLGPSCKSVYVLIDFPQDPAFQYEYICPGNRSAPSSSQIKNTVYRAVVPPFHNPTNLAFLLLMLVVMLNTVSQYIYIYIYIKHFYRTWYTVISTRVEIGKTRNCVETGRPKGGPKCGYLKIIYCILSDNSHVHWKYTIHIRNVVDMHRGLAMFWRIIFSIQYSPSSALRSELAGLNYMCMGICGVVIVVRYIDFNSLKMLWCTGCLKKRYGNSTGCRASSTLLNNSIFA